MIYTELRRAVSYRMAALMHHMMTPLSPRQNIVLLFNEQKRKRKTAGVYHNKIIAVIPKRLILLPRIT